MTGRRLVQSLVTAALLLIPGVLCLVNARLTPWALTGIASAIGGFYIVKPTGTLVERLERLVMIISGLGFGALTLTSVFALRSDPGGYEFLRVQQTIPYLLPPSILQRTRPTFATYLGRARLVDDEWIIRETMTLGREAAWVVGSSTAVAERLTRDLAEWEWVPDPAREPELAFSRERVLAADFGTLFPPRTTNVVELGIPIVRDGFGRMGTFRLTKGSRLSVVAEKYAITETFPPSPQVDLLREGLGRFDVPVQDTREVRLNLVSSSLRDPLPNALVTFSLNEWAKAVALAAATGGAVMATKVLRAREAEIDVPATADASRTPPRSQPLESPRPSDEPRGADETDSPAPTTTDDEAVRQPSD